MIIRYSIDWNKNPTPAISENHCSGVMELIMDEAFQVEYRKDKSPKLLKVQRGRKLIQFILDAGSDQNKTELHDYLYDSRGWFLEYLKVKYRGLKDGGGQVNKEIGAWDDNWNWIEENLFKKK